VTFCPVTFRPWLFVCDILSCDFLSYILSILPTISKTFEQLVQIFDLHFNIYLSAFRSGYSCQDTLIRIIEDWKNLLDNNQYATAILMDLSKAFDCLPQSSKLGGSPKPVACKMSSSTSPTGLWKKSHIVSKVDFIRYCV
jgi:hypothetical protein